VTVPGDAWDLLRCAARDRHLGGVLLIDLAPELLFPLARWTARAVGHATGRPTRLVALGPGTSEDDLWVRTTFEEDGPDFSVRTVAGLLVEEPDGPVPVVVVPDLARVSLAVQRAAVTLVGADTATVERHGFRAAWRPDARWLVACRWQDAMTLSPHLLDRFPIRLDGSGWVSAPSRSEAVARIDEPLDAVAQPAPPPPTVTPAVAARLDPDAVTHLQRITVASTGLRRDLAVARVARHHRPRGGDTVATAGHVTRAATLLGVDLASVEPADDTGTGGTDPDRSAPAPDPSGDGERGSGGGWTEAAEGTGGTLEASAPAELTRHGRRYPEDDDEALARPAALRVPGVRRSAVRRGHGQIIGVEQTRSLPDFAVVATIFEALRHQRARRETMPSAPRDTLILRARDLRRHRRRPQPDNALVLVLDHTCRARWDSGPILAPYLRWAYDTAALVTTVDFGHAGAVHELRAERFRADTVLHPHVVRSLNHRHGRASPLAYALDLAVDELRHLVRRRYPPVEHVRLVVVTDGRGNVPLDDSVRGAVAGPVGRAGVTDARAVAAAVATMRRVRAEVLAPPVPHYPDLPFDLAAAMGGDVMTIQDDDPADAGTAAEAAR
jgi:magnesium chelatase subunit D